MEQEYFTEQPKKEKFAVKILDGERSYLDLFTLLEYNSGKATPLI